MYLYSFVLSAKRPAELSLKETRLLSNGARLTPLVHGSLAAFREPAALECRIFLSRIERPPFHQLSAIHAHLTRRPSERRYRFAFSRYWPRRWIRLDSSSPARTPLSSRNVAFFFFNRVRFGMSFGIVLDDPFRIDISPANSFQSICIVRFCLRLRKETWRIFKYFLFYSYVFFLNSILFFYEIWRNRSIIVANHYLIFGGSNYLSEGSL